MIGDIRTMIRFTVFGDLHFKDKDVLQDKYGYLHGMLLYKQALCVDVEIDDEEIRIKGMDGDYLSVTPDDVELYDYRWNGVSIKAQTSSRVISRKKN